MKTTRYFTLMMAALNAGLFAISDSGISGGMCCFFLGCWFEQAVSHRLIAAQDSLIAVQREYIAKLEERELRRVNQG